MAPPRPHEPQRIAKLLARAGVASRREVERMIAEGRIALNGTAIDTPATLLESLHGVTVDGVAVAAPEPARLFRYHKPAGLLTTERDPASRPTIYNRLPPGLPRLVPVGRLDLNTEGLLLLTTDGELKRELELPASGVERSYRARAYGQVSQAQLEELIDGIEIEGVRYGSIDANLERRTGANVWIELTLTEGKNREVRRVLEHLGLRVSRLIRTRYGPFYLGDLEAGDVDEIRQHDLVTFRTVLAKPGGGKAASNLQFAVRARAEVPKPKPRADDPPREEAKSEPRVRRPKSERVGTLTTRVTPSRKERPAGDEGVAKPQRAARARAHREATGQPPRSQDKRPQKPKKPAAISRADREAEDRAAFVDRPKKRYRPGDRRPRRPTTPKPRAPK
jgi:23S rRNA pseudouridine2605 synthase